MNGKDRSDSETGQLPNINLSCHMLMQLGSGASYGVNMSAHLSSLVSEATGGNMSDFWAGSDCLTCNLQVLDEVLGGGRCRKHPYRVLLKFLFYHFAILVAKVMMPREILWPVLKSEICTQILVIPVLSSR